MNARTWVAANRTVFTRLALALAGLALCACAPRSPPAAAAPPADKPTHRARAHTASAASTADPTWPTPTSVSLCVNTAGQACSTSPFDG